MPPLGKEMQGLLADFAVLADFAFLANPVMLGALVEVCNGSVDCNPEPFVLGL